jgi:hypothetical protein
LSLTRVLSGSAVKTLNLERLSAGGGLSLIALGTGLALTGRKD